jgi:DNA primase
MITTARASGGGGWMRANCLVCPERAGKNDTKQSFSVNSKSGYYRCLRCGLKGFAEGAERRFSDKALEDSARKAEQGDEECRRLPGGFYQLDAEPALSSRSAQVARDYLDKRGISVQKRLRTGIGACLVPGERFYGRIICPLRGTYGKNDIDLKFNTVTQSNNCIILQSV